MSEPDARSGITGGVAAAIPLAVTALLAVIGASGTLPLPTRGIPVATLVAVAIQIGGIILARELELERWRRLWWMALACTTMVLPALTLQAAISRTPFVSWSSGAAGPLLWVTLGCLVLLTALWLWTAMVSVDEPAAAALVWLPAALLVPAMLSTPSSTIDERSGLIALAIATGLSAAAVLLGEISPPSSLLPIAATAYSAAMIVLWLLGRTPSFPPDQGRIVVAAGTLLLLVSIASLVAVPAASLMVQKFSTLVDEMTPPSVAGRQSRRRDSS